MNKNIQKFIDIPKEEKWWQRESEIPIELNDVPMFNNNTVDIKNSEFVELQCQMDELVYNFLKSHNEINGAYSFTYSIDDISSLRENGVDCPSCDRLLRIVDNKYKTIVLSM